MVGWGCFIYFEGCGEGFVEFVVDFLEFFFYGLFLLLVEGGDVWERD